ncbi:hypothetical protein [Photorhabdus aballayi]|nr:hypothetical protein [Photorhabdus aballayi]
MVLKEHSNSGKVRLSSITKQRMRTK